MCIFSFSQITKKRDCDSLNNAVTFDPSTVTSTPNSVPNVVSAKVEAGDRADARAPLENALPVAVHAPAQRREQTETGDDNAAHERSSLQNPDCKQAMAAGRPLLGARHGGHQSRFEVWAISPPPSRR